MDTLPQFTQTGLFGDAVNTMVRTVSDLEGVFLDTEAFGHCNPDTVVYRVESYTPVAAGIEGGLFFGVTHLMPGQIGSEYFMTKGHFHEKRNRAEFYWGMAGQGLLVLMSETGEGWTEEVRPGSLHYVPAHTAHRLINIGTTVLRVGACWPSDAGHDYGSIAEGGFPIRVMAGATVPEIITP